MVVMTVHLPSTACPVLVLPTLLLYTLSMFSPRKGTGFPLWTYLNQPVFTPRHKTILNPRRFWYLHRIEVLERCLAKDCASKDYRHRD